MGASCPACVNASRIGQEGSNKDDSTTDESWHLVVDGVTGKSCESFKAGACLSGCGDGIGPRDSFFSALLSGGGNTNGDRAFCEDVELPEQSFPSGQPPGKAGRVAESRVQDGHAREVWPDGAYYDGQFLNGRKQGHGTFVWVDGSKYDGQFRDNCMDGLGLYAWLDGRKYDGEWRANTMHGHGKFLWPDGRTYEGAYVKDAKHGNGTFRWPDGRQYDGQWCEGKEHGVGEFTTGRGERLRGKWQEGHRLNWFSK